MGFQRGSLPGPWPGAIRIQYPGAVYHVMARGNHGQKILQDDRDRQRFPETLGESCKKTGLRISRLRAEEHLMDRHTRAGLKDGGGSC